jgi:hypothetical protein
MAQLRPKAMASFASFFYSWILHSVACSYVVMDVAIFRDIDPCSSCVNQPPNARWLLARLILDPEDIDDSFIRNVCSHTDYTALYRRRWQQRQFSLAA